MTDFESAKDVHGFHSDHRQIKLEAKGMPRIWNNIMYGVCMARHGDLSHSDAYAECKHWID